MATGILGQSAPAAAVNTTVYTVPATTVATVSISVTSRVAQGGTISIALAGTGTPADAEWIEFNTYIPGNTAFERTGIVLNAAENIVVFASAGFSVSVYGYEAASA